MLTGSKGLGELVTPFAVQQTDVHFRRQRRGIKFFDHLHRRAGVARQGQQIDVAAKNQPECDGSVSQAVKTAVCPMWTGLDAQRIQNPVEQPTDGIETAQTVFFFGEKHIVIRLAIAQGGLVRQ